jgi:hypothetical protein
MFRYRSAVCGACVWRMRHPLWDRAFAPDPPQTAAPFSPPPAYTRNAIHPGHRFSSESAEFAIVCAKEASPSAAHRRPRFGNRDGKTGASGRSGGGSGNGGGGLRSCASEPVRSSPSGGRRRPKADAPRRCGIRSRRPRARHLQRGGTLLPMAKFTWKNPPEPGAPRPCAGEIPGVLESLAAFQSSRTPMAIIDTGGQGSE